MSVSRKKTIVGTVGYVLDWTPITDFRSKVDRSNVKNNYFRGYLNNIKKWLESKTFIHSQVGPNYFNRGWH